jgi:hypothetical protein
MKLISKIGVFADSDLCSSWPETSRPQNTANIGVAAMEK